MVYISKKRGLKDFFKTKNLKYYIAFFMIFLTLIAVIVIISRNIKPESDVVENETTEDETDTGHQDETASALRGVYRICVNKATHMVSAYQYNEADGAYSDSPSRYMIAGIGVIENGTYSSGEGSKRSWSETDDGYYRYYSDFGEGIIFHSAIYNTMNDKNSLDVSDYEKIGTDTDGTGITLQLADAKWIYENCSFESEIVVYEDEDEEIDADFIDIMEIPDGITWEPTDDAEGSVWCPSEAVSLDCADEITVTAGSGMGAVLSHVNARGRAGESLISYVYITGEYNLNQAGSYNITLNLADLYGNYLTRQTRLIVEDDETAAPDTSEAETTEDDVTVSEPAESGTDENSTTADNETRQETSEIQETTSAVDDIAETTVPEETMTEGQPADETIPDETEGSETD